MATLYLTEQGAVAHKVNERVVVTKDDRVLADIPLIKVDQVQVFGRGVALTSALMVYLMEHGIDTVFLSQAQRYRGRLLGRGTMHGALRTAQVRAAGDEQRALDLAGAVVRGKLVNQRFLLRRHAGDRPLVRQAMDGIKVMLDRVDGVTTLDTLRGVEGQAAALYFAGLRRMLRHDFGFARRVHHPPTDPVNALLSFGYTLLLNDLISALHLVGLDPYIGFFHALAHGRPSLALDLEEEFRPVIVDSVALALLNSGALGPHDFRRGDDPKRPVMLTDAGRTLVLRRYNERLDTSVRHPVTGERAAYRRILELQARALAHALTESQPYRAFEAQ